MKKITKVGIGSVLVASLFTALPFAGSAVSNSASAPAVVREAAKSVSVPEARADWQVDCWRTIFNKIVCYRYWTPGFGGGGGGGW